ncbi:MAG: restriction endonuclease subunit S [Negativicoccus succinicivorans]|nr:restriction endonuclease subunit S [Negativicoccus succinicivorans]
MEQNKNVPQIRFEGFEGAWNNCKIEDVVDIGNGMDYKHLKKGSIPVYGTGGYLLSVDKALSEDRDAIGIGRKGTIDKPYILRAPFWTVDTLFYCIPKAYHDLNFINLTFQSINWKKRDESTGVPSLSKANINKVEIKIPSYIEQKVIGSYFSTLDNIINIYQQKYEKFLDLKKAMLYKLFPKEGETTPEIRFDGFSGAWEKEKLGNLGYSYTGLSGKTKDDFGHGKARFITYMNVFSNSTTDTKLAEPIEVDPKQHEVEVGDVFFTTSSETPEEVGMSSVLIEKEGTIYLNSFCFGYRPTYCFDRYFLAYMLRSEVIRKEIILLAQGISRYNISKKSVMDIEVFTPTIEEQKAIGEYFSKLDQLIALNKEKLAKLKNIKSLLLDKMFV